MVGHRFEIVEYSNEAYPKREETLHISPKTQGSRIIGITRALNIIKMQVLRTCNIPQAHPTYFVITNVYCTCSGEQLKAKAPPETKLYILYMLNYLCRKPT